MVSLYHIRPLFSTFDSEKSGKLATTSRKCLTMTTVSHPPLISIYFSPCNHIHTPGDADIKLVESDGDRDTCVKHSLYMQDKLVGHGKVVNRTWYLSISSLQTVSLILKSKDKLSEYNILRNKGGTHCCNFMRLLQSGNWEILL